MGLKCSVLGHKYGDATVERDREEQGSEVVITIREIETCTRCGQERVVSENKEVTSIATPEEPADDGATGGVADRDDAQTASDREPASDEASASGAGPPGDESVPADEPAADGVDDGVGVDADVTDHAMPGDADAGAEILDADADEPVSDDELADPSIEESPADPDPTPEDGEDAVIMGAGDDVDEPSDDDETEAREVGEWPEEPDDGDAGWSPDDALEDETTITAPDEGTEANAAVTIPEGEFACPECGYTTPVEASSLRAGDFCPECRTGALVHERGD